MPTPRAQTQIQHTNGHSKSVASGLTERAYDAVSTYASVAQEQIIKTAATTEKVVKANPLSSVGVALGGGVLLGALAMKLFSHKPTLAEAVHDRLGLKRKIARTIQSWL